MFGRETDQLAVSKYLRRFGSHIRSVHFTSDAMTYEVLLATLYCRSLENISSEMIDITALRELLHYNPDIQQLSLENADVETADFFDDICLLKLSRLSLLDINSTIVFPWTVLVGPSLRGVELTGLDWFDANDLIAVAQLCPNLSAIGLSWIDLDTAALDEFTTLCPHVLDFDLRSEQADDDVILSIVKNLKSLRTLNIHDCAAITNCALDHIATHCKATLKFLGFDLVDADSFRSLQAILQRCTSLISLSVYAPIGTIYISGGTSLSNHALVHIAEQCRNTLKHIGFDVADAESFQSNIFERCAARLSMSAAAGAPGPNDATLGELFALMKGLQRLSLGGALVCEKVLCLVGQCCPNLTYLNITLEDDELSLNPTAFHLDKSPRRLALGCPRLRVVVTERYDDISPAVRELWNALCPKLRFRMTVDLPAYSVFTQGDML